MNFGEPFGGLIPGARGAVLAILLRTGVPLTGRQIHGMVSDDFSLWSVQEALKALAEFGVVETQTIGRAGAHTINEDHSAVAHLRALVDPVGILTAVVAETIDAEVSTVLIFGSIARGEATRRSDVDLTVIATEGWKGREKLEDAIRTRVGTACDVLVFTESEFSRLARSGEPVVSDILRDGIALVGTKPQPSKGAA